jgi:cytochrome oxidase Cu insertion factor (SCO1/SenC/PrrC family)
MALRARVQRGWAVLVPLTLLTALWAFGQEKTEGVKLGAVVPDFTLSNSEGKAVSLKDFRGEKQVALVFYPALFRAGG